MAAKVPAMVAITVANELGCGVSAFDILPNLFYPALLLLSSLVFIFFVPERSRKK